MPGLRRSPRATPGPGSGGPTIRDEVGETVREEFESGFGGGGALVGEEAVLVGDEGRGRGPLKWGLSFAAWLAIGWMVFIVIIAVLAKIGPRHVGRPAERHRVVRPQGALRERGHRAGPPARLRQRRAGHDRPARARGVDVPAGRHRVRRAGLPDRRHARAHRRLLRWPHRLVPGRHVQRAALRPRRRARPRARRVPAGQRAGRHGHRPAGRRDPHHRHRGRGHPAHRADLAGERPHVEPARVRARGPRAGRQERSRHVAGGAPERAAGDGVDRAAQRRDRHRRRGRPGDPRGRGPAADAVVGQHASPSTAGSSSPHPTSSSSPRC